MAVDVREQLGAIRTFPSLVKYLRDELDWPITTDSFEDLTFDYSPEELGIDAANAAKIHEIKRMRPLSANQPWGIFFVKFEPKRLPVVALRRILSRVVLKKRASANHAERTAWAPDDLLFISSYGEDEERRISLAHFSEDSGSTGLPTLRVLGWDNLDTPLHLDHVAETLRRNLKWPEDDEDLDSWRETWRSAFLLRHREVITTSRDLAIRLAELARAIRDRIQSALAIETQAGPLAKLMKAFQAALVHDLDADGFADMYAQTIAYGLLCARIADPKAKTTEDLADYMRTNPLLGELMTTFLSVGGKAGGSADQSIDFDELGVGDVVRLLDRANMEAVVRDFGDKNPEEDPVIRFYEDFLREYDPKEKVRRGVFYTPRPVVSYIVHSVDELLRTEFGLEDGLADTTTWGEMVKRHKDLRTPVGVSPDEAFVQILDPAAGTGTFLVEVIGIVHRTMTRKWEEEAGGPLLANADARWNEYVSKHLLTRLHGYELLMAPYAIAHLKIGLKLHETGYRFESDERARIYLTNALEQAQDFSGRLEFAIPALAHEAQKVNEIKRERRFTVVIGNPPYSSSVSEPSWLMTLLEDWKRGLNETKSDLNREEWKFLRFGQHHCESSGCGILGFIINRDFLDGITKRGMREHLRQSFPLVTIVDLNGDVKGNISDENVFEIEQGVAIAMLCTKSDLPRFRFSSRVGTRASKYADLVSKTSINRDLVIAEPTAPYFRWVPLAHGGDAEDAASEYAAWPSLADVFRVRSSGIQTKNDSVCIGWTETEIWDRVNLLVNTPAEQLSDELGVREGGAWSIVSAKEDLRKTGLSKSRIRRILYRPFDWRYTYLTEKSGGFLGRPRFAVMKHMASNSNIGLIFNRQIVGDSVSQFGVSRDVICHGTFYLGNKGQDYLAPLYLMESEGLGLPSQRLIPNFTRPFVRLLEDTSGRGASEVVPEQLLSYLYSIVHSPTYRHRYCEYLKLDFPRVPLTCKRPLFQSLACLGDELVALHLMDSPELSNLSAVYVGPPRPEIKRVGWSDNMVWLDAAATKKGQPVTPGTMGFRGVPEEVWNFHVGGYQVCEKWLKDRKGRTLSDEELVHYQKIVVAINETIRIMGEIDEVIEEHGGMGGCLPDGC